MPAIFLWCLQPGGVRRDRGGAPGAGGGQYRLRDGQCVQRQANAGSGEEVFMNAADMDDERIFQCSSRGPGA